VSEAADGSLTALSGNEAVSMNCWGFGGGFVGELERLFTAFLKEKGGELKSEFYLPGAVDSLIKEKRAAISMLRSSASWFGVTYREDREPVCKALAEAVASGEYPTPLF
jgi:hypothetical protein